jgi:hypothetical protein
VVGVVPRMALDLDERLLTERFPDPRQVLWTRVIPFAPHTQFSDFNGCRP